MTDPLPSSPMRTIVRWGLYPFSWVVVLTGFCLIKMTDIGNDVIYAACVGSLVILYIIIEWSLPYEMRWSMSLRSFFSDMKFAVVNSIFVAGLSGLLALFAISMSAENTGPASSWPEPLQLLTSLLIFEAINYFIHRTMHESPGAIGRFLWRTHAAHHLPPRLYVIMHGVFHPLNGIVVQGFAVIIPIWFMGYSQDVVTMHLILTGMHGAISHFNADVRTGWMNYLFVGPELHRYHHSAKLEERKNYANVLSIYDQIFGTFVYRPGVPPDELGVDPAAGMPSYDRTLDVLKLPFVRQQSFSPDNTP